MGVRTVLHGGVAMLVFAACTAPAVSSPSPSAGPTTSPTPAPTTRPTATPTPAPSSTPAGSPSAAVVVTFTVVGETYRILLTDPVDIAIANRLLAGDEAPSIPSGRIVRGETSVNEGYSWSIDPESVEFADATIEVCDGLPSHVEDGTLAGDQYCPWSAEVVDLEPAE